MQQSIVSPDWTKVPQFAPPAAPQAAIGRPKVTVMLITYNHAKYIGEAIESILAQRTDFSFAIHVIDDCSTDGAQDIIRDYAARYPGVVKPFINAQNIGREVTQKNFYRGMQTLDGDYICILEGDDYWIDPDRLQRHVAFLEENPDFVACANNTLKVYEDGSKEPHLLQPPQPREVHDIDDLIMISSFFHASSLTFRNVFRGAVPKYLSSPLSCDIFINIAHAQFGKIRFYPEPASVYRAHGGGLFSQMSQTKGWMWNIDSFQACNRWLGYRHVRTFARSIWNYCNLLLVHGREEDGLTPQMRRKYEKVRDRYRALDRLLVRGDLALARWLPGWKPRTGPAVLELGCGDRKPLRRVTVDCRRETDPDVLADLEQPRWPFPDNYAEEVHFDRSLEHMGRDFATFQAMIRELYRVCRSGARVYITAKHPWHNSFVNDPTVVRVVTPTIMAMFDRTTPMTAEPAPVAVANGVDFELAQRQISLDEPYLTQYQTGQISHNDVARLIDSNVNVCTGFQIELVVHKPPRA